MTAISGKKTDVWSMKLIFLLAFAGVGLITSYAFAAGEPVPVINENAFLDPFALTTYQPQGTSSSTSRGWDAHLSIRSCSVSRSWPR